ncbi:enoyl-CoA hydratase [Alicyclobacillus cycloheptanicus]|uniref:Enoyl-CoA hydratase/carnithine racemase n=2 Tax=Alicyclobacillus cycloheptanicus TaxID=1457 RepID=A0ABT9XDR9_9BACL|nr:enoyl-CoA hydratase [Alicyclobacillus cycloheptanicus]MDQ0188224.1 enoyl-CoA hydratase/carnithine racemase [Alicyclobacillus cycloheptanicus]WDM00953.1 enoyl-CoA hydratase [Alicyclobacillus cycloheptanicus]
MGEVRIEREQEIAVLTLDNPPMNVLSLDMSRQILEAVQELEHDRSVVAVVLTGAGDRAFMAGADIKEFTGFIADKKAGSAAEAFDETMQRLHHLSKPTVAALNGWTLGGGCELALACDFRIAEEQIMLGFPEVKLGLFPGAGGTQRLPRLIGESRAKQLILTGEPIPAAEAERIGLVNRVVPKGQALAEAKQFAAIFRERSQVSIGLAKRAIDEGLDVTLDEGLKMEARLFGEVFEAEDVAEGVQAFLEKRAPKFQHR